MKEILEPYEYLVKNPGKDFRTQLIAAFDIWLKVPEKQRELVSQIVAMLHTSSLLIDDVEDGSELRRGLPVAHKIYGIAKTINAANYVYFQALEKTMELHSSDAIHTFTHELLNLHYGQGCEIHWRDCVECPTEAQYLEMYHDAKGFAEDITEGKFSFPIVHCLQSRPEKKNALLSILRQRTNDVEVKKYAISILKESGSLEYTKTYLQGLEQKAFRMIEELGGNTILVAMLHQLSQSYKE